MCSIDGHSLGRDDRVQGDAVDGGEERCGGRGDFGGVEVPLLGE